MATKISCDYFPFDRTYNFFLSVKRELQRSIQIIKCFYYLHIYVFQHMCVYVFYLGYYMQLYCTVCLGQMCQSPSTSTFHLHRAMSIKKGWDKQARLNTRYIEKVKKHPCNCFSHIDGGDENLFIVLVCFKYSPVQHKKKPIPNTIDPLPLSLSIFIWTRMWSGKNPVPQWKCQQPMLLHSVSVQRPTLCSPLCSCLLNW